MSWARSALVAWVTLVALALLITGMVLPIYIGLYLFGTAGLLAGFLLVCFVGLTVMVRLIAEAS